MTAPRALDRAGPAPPGYRVRAAEERDLDALPGIERRAASLYAGRLDPELLELERERDELADGLASGWLWVAVDARDRPVGFALGRELGGDAHLEELDVEPEHGRRGLGRALVERMCRAARRRGHTQLTLTTYADVPWNAPWYERLGFRVLARGELRPVHERVIETERGWGLDWSRRVVMRRRVGWLRDALLWAAAAWLAGAVALSAIASTRPGWVRRPFGLSLDDKPGHFLLMGGLAFFAVLALSGRRVGGRRASEALVLGAVAALAAADELSQIWLPLRTFSLEDLAASLSGVAVLGGAAAAWRAQQRRRS